MADRDSKLNGRKHRWIYTRQFSQNYQLHTCSHCDKTRIIDVIKAERELKKIIKRNIERIERGMI